MLKFTSWWLPDGFRLDQVDWVLELREQYPDLLEPWDFDHGPSWALCAHELGRETLEDARTFRSSPLAEWHAAYLPWPSPKTRLGAGLVGDLPQSGWFCSTQRVLAARITCSGRVVRLRLDRSWFWAKALALGFERLRAAFA